MQIHTFDGFIVVGNSRKPIEFQNLLTGDKYHLIARRSGSLHRFLTPKKRAELKMGDMLYFITPLTDYNRREISARARLEGIQFKLISYKDEKAIEELLND